jgi:peptidylamidoglycolate lyase
MIATQWMLPLALLTACQTIALSEREHDRLWPEATVDAHGRNGVVGVDVNSRDEVHLFHRAGRVWDEDTPTTPLTEPTILVLAGGTGKALRAWGSNRFVVPHGLTIDAHDNVWTTDVKLHQVMKFSPSGELLLVLGEAGVSGRDSTHFDGPTDVAVLPDGSFYVSDGYGNARVAKFTANGRFEFSWGSRGKAEGQFRIPHAIAVSRKGQVYVADRENSRVQIFSKLGGFVREWSTLPVEKPFGLSLYNGRVALTGDVAQTAPLPSSIRIAEFSEWGKLLSTTVTLREVGQGGDDIAISSGGDIYVVGPWKHGIERFVRRHARQQRHPE